MNAKIYKTCFSFISSGNTLFIGFFSTCRSIVKYKNGVNIILRPIATTRYKKLFHQGVAHKLTKKLPAIKTIKDTIAANIRILYGNESFLLILNL